MMTTWPTLSIRGVEMSVRPKGAYGMRAAAYLATVVGLLAACALLPGGNQRQVTRAEFGNDWPLTVESGLLACEGSDSITFETGGKTYAVVDHGIAPFGEPIDPIWADDPTGGASMKKDLEPLMSAGFPLCP
jgi:uncharacterized protein DUF2511